MVVVCVVCGVPLQPPLPPAYRAIGVTNMAWRNPCILKAVPLTFKAWQAMDAKVQTKAIKEGRDDGLLVEIPATRLELGRSAGTFCELVVIPPPGPHMSPEISHRLHRIDSTESPINVPLHPDCLTVAKEFCTYQKKFAIDFRAPVGKQAGGEPSHLTHLYEIWCNRIIATYPYGLVTMAVKESHDYFGIPKFASLTDWNRMRETRKELKYFEKSPLAVQFLTRTLLNRLRLIPKDDSPDPNMTELQARMESLPAELAEKCNLECSRLFHPNWWRNQLLRGRFIPWLWDVSWKELDGKFIPEDDGSNQDSLKKERDVQHVWAVEDIIVSADSNDASTSTANSTQQQLAKPAEEQEKDWTKLDWDWEYLVRQLAQHNVLGPTGVLGDAPQELRVALLNRRRIWELINQSRLGHMTWSVVDPPSP
ncbi:hypothetical protein BJ170DRAFT_733898 [Xylariales sp. AK1849]|nr:hypothetical protein BJ170DRAFT_733898 [Xylariales sp. AK1849]